MMPKIFRALKVVTCAVLIAQLSGCGTIMYPNRRGQQAGKIDAGVAVLDGIGFLLFVIPGFIAFAIDFNTGAIYLPGTSRSALNTKRIKVVSFDAMNSTNAHLENIIEQETGCDISFDKAIITKIASMDEANLEKIVYLDTRRAGKN
jgi:hypothetical protein